MRHPLPVELFLASAAIAAFLIFVVYRAATLAT
jgi:hypothetical protein